MPDIAEALAIGIQRHQAGDLSGADQAYRAILKVQPQHADALHLLGLLQQQAGNTPAALELIQRAIQISPQSHYFSNLGKIYDNLKQLPAAIECYKRYLAASPSDVPILTNLSICLMQMQRFDEAMPVLERVLQLQPQHADAWANMAILWRAQDDAAKAIACAERAVQLDPQNADNLSNLGTMYRKVKDYRRAKECHEAALKIRPGHAIYLSNLGNVYDDLCDHHTAEKVLNLALKSDPQNYEAQYNLANVQRNLGRHDEAMQRYQQLLQRNPNHAEVHTSHAVLLLYQHEYAAGWQEFEWRWKLAKPRNFSQPWWNGESLANKTILLWSEQGLGDTLHFVRYIPLLKAQGARVALSCQAALHPLLKNFPGVDALLAEDETLQQFDYHLPLMSLPRVMQTDRHSIPCSIPYLTADPERVATWRERLKNIAGFRVGIVWQGFKDYMSDQLRSFPLQQYAPLADIPNVQLISLQFGYGAEQLRDPKRTFPVHELGPVDQEGAFLDTAAILKNIDLLVSSDTSIVHLAGAMGVPTLLALNLSPNWRWPEGETNSTWYPSIQLFKQTTAGDWPSVVARIATEIRQRSNAPAR
jgi:tetratricopeptide (TPR) repeat protein